MLTIELDAAIHIAQQCPRQTCPTELNRPCDSNWGSPELLLIKKTNDLQSGNSKHAWELVRCNSSWVGYLLIHQRTIPIANNWWQPSRFFQAVVDGRFFSAFESFDVSGVRIAVLTLSQNNNLGRLFNIAQNRCVSCCDGDTVWASWTKGCGFESFQVIDFFYLSINSPEIRGPACCAGGHGFATY